MNRDHVRAHQWAKYPLLSKKLETIYDRIETVKARFEVLLRDARLNAYEREKAGEDAEIMLFDLA